jgi:moderate conductance mechanosensitive channel
MLLAIELGDLERWARGSALEIVLLALGAVLLTRALHWVMLDLPSRVAGLRLFEGLELNSESIEGRRARAVVQASTWGLSALVYVVTTLLILQKFNVPLASLVPPATVAGVAVGFGAQKIVQDLLSGFFLFAERQLTVGDVVRIGDPGSTTGVGGTVEELTLRTTRLRTLKGEVVFIPNGEIRQVTNLSVDWARVVIDVPVRADDSFDRAMGVLRDVGADLLADPAWAESFLDAPAVAGVETLDVGYLRVRLMARVRADRQWDVGRELRRRIATGLSDAGVVPLTPIMVPPTMGG